MRGEELGTQHGHGLEDQLGPVARNVYPHKSALPSHERCDRRARVQDWAKFECRDVVRCTPTWRHSQYVACVKGSCFEMTFDFPTKG